MSSSDSFGVLRTQRVHRQEAVEIHPGWIMRNLSESMGKKFWRSVREVVKVSIAVVFVRGELKGAFETDRTVDPDETSLVMY